MTKNRVLIVEDEGILAMDMAHSLESMGYIVTETVAAGEDAVLAAARGNPDLILMDIQLSGEIDGIQAAERIHEDHNIPIIYISGHTDELTLSRAKITGPYAYIPKSFNYDDLRTAIEMAIYKNELQQKVIDNEYLLNTTLESIEDAVITIDTKGYVKYLNSKAASMFSIRKEKAIEAKIDKLGISFLNINGKPMVHPFSKERRRRIKTTEYTMINEAAGSGVSVECTINPLPAAKHKISGYVYLIKNIEERKKMEAIRSRLASIIESSKDAIIGIDTRGIIKTWNKGAERILGYSQDEVVGQNISMLTPSSHPNELPEKIERLKNGKAIEHYESVRQTKNGNLIQMSILPSAIKDSTGKITGISFIARDITEKKELEKEVMEISERERERIGQDLHDSLGQQLTGILLNLKFTEKELKAVNPDLDLKRLSETRELIKIAISQTRNMAKTLVPIKLQTEGLPYALSDLANYAQEVYSKEVETQIDYEIQCMDIISETQLYHIAQEAINNAVKHSGCKKIVISLGMAQNELVLSIKDNGRGMEQDSGDGLGLKIMKYRANLINGTIFINSEKGEGTVFNCRVPVQVAETE